MANNLIPIPEELNALIQQYLTDGVLTDKERAVILNEAESMGLNREKIDLYLDAEVQKIDQETDAAVRRQKGKTCPFCGGPVPQLADKCPHCGQFITATADKDLERAINRMERALKNFMYYKNDTSRVKVESHLRELKAYYGNNPKVQALVREVEEGMKAVDEKGRKEKNKERYGVIGAIALLFAIILLCFLMPLLQK